MNVYEPIEMLKSMPPVSLEVLVSTLKVCAKADTFNFEAVYQKYLSWKRLQTSRVKASSLPKAVFLKTFLDLVEKGFIDCHSPDMGEVANINTKLALGFRRNDLENMI